MQLYDLLLLAQVTDPPPPAPEVFDITLRNVPATFDIYLDTVTPPGGTRRIFIIV